MTRANMQKRCQGVQDNFFGVADLVKMWCYYSFLW